MLRSSVLHEIAGALFHSQLTPTVGYKSSVSTDGIRAAVQGSRGRDGLMSSGLLVFTDHLHGSQSPRCGRLPHITRQSQSHGVTRSAPLHPTCDGMTPLSMKEPPDPCRH